MGKWAETSSFGMWVLNALRTKSWLTSKTFWNETGQKLMAVFGYWEVADPSIEAQIVSLVIALGSIGSSMFVRKKTTTPMGAALPSKPKSPTIDEHEDVFLDSDD